MEKKITMMGSFICEEFPALRCESNGWQLALTAIGGDGNSNSQRSYFQILAIHRGVFLISPAAIWQYSSCVAMLYLTIA